MKQRITSGAVIAILIVVLGFLGGPFLAVTIMLCSMIGYGELGRVAGFVQREQKVNLITGLALGITVLYYIGLIVLASRWGNDPQTLVYASDFFTMVILVVAFLALMIAYVLTFPAFRSEQIMAGFFIDVAVIFSNVVGNLFPADVMPGWGKLLSSIVFSIAVILISLVGGELFSNRIIQRS